MRDIVIPSCVPKLMLPAVYVNLDHVFCFHCVCPIGSSLEGRQWHKVLKKALSAFLYTHTQCQYGAVTWWLGVRRFLTWLNEEGEDDEEGVLGMFWNFFVMKSVCERKVWCYFLISLCWRFRKNVLAALSLLNSPQLHPEVMDCSQCPLGLNDLFFSL